MSQISDINNTKIKSQEYKISDSKYWGDIHCGNCGKIGHVYKKCYQPIQSMGIILFRFKKKIDKVMSSYSVKEDFFLNNLEFLLIRRRNTLGFMEFIRGRYSFSDVNFIMSLFNEMTLEEKRYIATLTFENIWNILWLKKQNSKNKYKTEYKIAKNKFQTLKQGIQIDYGKILSIQVLLNNSKTSWLEAEWGFPKGRRKSYEDDKTCACREFCEETGYIDEEYKLSPIKPVEELFLGSNNVCYRHLYYIGESLTKKEPHINPDNYIQSTEIGDIGWFNYLDANKKIRDYSIEKKNVLEKTFKLILNYYL